VNNRLAIEFAFVEVTRGKYEREAEEWKWEFELEFEQHFSGNRG